MLKIAYNAGVKAAIAHFKLAETVLGASPGVAPRGEEVSHGSDRIQDAPQSAEVPPSGQGHQSPTQDKAHNAVDWLWNISEYDKLAPGGAGGQFGEEVIG